MIDKAVRAVSTKTSTNVSSLIAEMRCFTQPRGSALSAAAKDVGALMTTISWSAFKFSLFHKVVMRTRARIGCRRDL